MPKSNFEALVAAWMAETPAGGVVTYRDVIRFATNAFAAFEGEAQ